MGKTTLDFWLLLKTLLAKEFLFYRTMLRLGLVNVESHNFQFFEELLCHSKQQLSAWNILLMMPFDFTRMVLNFFAFLWSSIDWLHLFLNSWNLFLTFILTCWCLFSAWVLEGLLFPVWWYFLWFWWAFSRILADSRQPDAW